MDRTIDSVRSWWKRSDLVRRLIAVNVFVFILLWLVRFFTSLFGTWHLVPELWLACYPYFHDLVSHPWGILTYMFVHADVWHLLFNMLWLFWLGHLFLHYHGHRRLLAVYLSGGVIAGLFYILIFNLLNTAGVYMLGAPVIGASGAVMAVVFGIAFYAKWERVNLFFLGSVRIPYLALGMLVLDLLLLGTDGNLGGHLAHIGGALYGYLFASLSIRKHRDITEPVQRFIDWLVDTWGILTDRRKRVNRRIRRRAEEVQRQRDVKKETDSAKQRADASQTSPSEAELRQERIDRILDKIRRSGYASLTSEEKKELFEQSRKL
ncbi:rhomboid family intramembrane serine protease [Porphyromonas macacae]|uniref:Rhomboid family n=1 Tax=Porphyromonas macacae TaxID=28115 RepID=A0A379DFS5_9PORP|nr:rhomboid family intramembrane serine protease [Porphyromonas macacae]SUB76893.1 Rhomboid family [Porphyromonas macacae]